jgi:SAM-dependent methyltransferase
MSRPQRYVSWRFRAGAGPAIGLSQAQRSQVAQVAALLRDGGCTLESGSCVCGQSEGPKIAGVDRYGLPLDTVLCCACGTLRFDPYITAGGLNRFYGSHYQQMYARVPDAVTYFERQRGYGRRVLEHLRRHGATPQVAVEVGCGAGGALSVFAEAGAAVIGCDLSEPLIEYGRERGVENLAVEDLSGLTRRMGGRHADIILLHHVFEHLSSPLDWLVDARALLADDGAIVIAVPDFTRIEGYPSPDGDLRLMLHIAHKFNFTIDGLQRLAERAGLRAFVLDVAPSREAPEVWVGFARVRPRWAAQAGVAEAVGASQLEAHLHAVERRFVRAAAVRKLRRLWSRFAG